MHISKTLRIHCLIYFLLLVIPGLFVIQTPVHAETILVDSFEGTLTWKADTVGDPAILSIVPENATEGNNSLHVAFQNNGKGEAIIYREGNMDLSRSQTLLLDITNPQSAVVYIATAFQTGSDWVYYESKPVPLQPGLNKNVLFYLTSPEYRCAESQWKFSSNLRNRDQVQRINFLIFTGSFKTGDIYLDNIRLQQAQGITSGATVTNRRTVLISGFENEVQWIPLAGSEPLDVSLSNEHVTEGNNSLKLTYQKGKTGMIGMMLDFTGLTEELKTSNGLLIDIFNTSNETTYFCVAFIMGRRWTWYESSMALLHQGLNKDIWIDLAGPTFKTPPSINQYKVSLPRDQKSNTLNLIIYPASSQKGVVYLDNLRFVK